MKKKIELLAPAGNLEKVRWAFLYGADAVYFGGQNYGLRANAQNLSVEEIKEACLYAHKLNKKVYVTVNIVFHDEDIDGLKEYLIALNNATVDAIIISDPLVIELAKEVIPNMEIHLSTQQNTLNYEACNYWYNEGVKRVVLGRESSKKDMLSILENSDIDLEVFIQGAMCVSYSGRCVLSNYFTNRDSNRGGCSQICRWNFDLYDEFKNKISTDNDFAITVKDLSMIPYIGELIDMGITSLKIEGRMRSIYYISTVLRVYRKVIDEYYENGSIEGMDKYIYELNRCANRESLPQFYLSKPGVNEQYYSDRLEESNKDFLGVVLSYDDEKKEITLEERNYFKVGDEITIFGPNTEDISVKVEYMKDEKDNAIEVARHPKEIVKIPCNIKVYENDLIRVKF